MPEYPAKVLVNQGNIGGNGGGEYGCLAQTGGLVESVGVWASGKDIIGVTIKFTNEDEKHKMGSGKWGDFSEFLFEAGETVKSLSLWGNGVGTNLGRIKFTTSTGRSFDWGAHKADKEYPMDVGSGLWVGIKGKCGATVDNMGVYFLKKVESMSMQDVKFKNDPTGTAQGIKSKSLKSVQYPWNGRPYTWTFQQPRLDKETHTVTETKSRSTALALGFKETWENKVNLFIDESKVTVEANQSLTFTWTTENSTADATESSDGLTAGASGQVQKAEDAVVVEATTWTGTVDLEYTAKIVVKMQSGDSYDIPTKGSMKKVAFSKVYVNVRPLSEDGNSLPPFDPEDNPPKENRELEVDPDEIPDENPEEFSQEEDTNPGVPNVLSEDPQQPQTLSYSGYNPSNEARAAYDRPFLDSNNDDRNEEQFEEDQEVPKRRTNEYYNEEDRSRPDTRDGNSAEWDTGRYDDNQEVYDYERRQFQEGEQPQGNTESRFGQGEETAYCRNDDSGGNEEYQPREDRGYALATPTESYRPEGEDYNHQWTPQQTKPPGMHGFESTEESNQDRYQAERPENESVAWREEQVGQEYDVPHRFGSYGAFSRNDEQDTHPRYRNEEEDGSEYLEQRAVEDPHPSYRRDEEDGLEGFDERHRGEQRGSRWREDDTAVF
ncbi:uncharacterized protein N7482_005178 [Penicillium canariense]|uniref:Jacalin-type lectin domain-containing protein n=1 Tax=Penicillium canariense TaxID=189055 RepID=A0A9W9I7H5_9EURO|nr:uncharacterized protein N7482_005178 [Penicillium canariense]KAJ5166397.1 hypothetical protein N7482_005178 [Penicillium canariense]